MNQITEKQLEAIILFFIANDETCGQLFDPQKCFEFDISRNPFGVGFTVDYKWYSGIVLNENIDPSVGYDDKYITADGGFRILETESFTTLFKYLTDMCNEVNEDEFVKE